MIILLILLALSIIFVCLLNGELGRDKIEKEGRLKEKNEQANENKNPQKTEVIEINNIPNNG